MVIKNMSYCERATTPYMIEMASKLSGIVIETDDNYVKIVWSDNYGVFWNCPESLEVVSENR